MTEKHVFKRIWTYLRKYKTSLISAVLLKVVSALMSSLEPFVLGLAITEISNNLIEMAKGVEGAGINKSYIAFILFLYFIRAVFFEIGSYGSNYFMTKAVQSGIKDLRQDLSHKINKIPVSYFDSNINNYKN